MSVYWFLGFDALNWAQVKDPLKRRRSLGACLNRVDSDRGARLLTKRLPLGPTLHTFTLIFHRFVDPFNITLRVHADPPDKDQKNVASRKSFTCVA